MTSLFKDMSPMRLLAIIVMAAIPLFIITALNVLFQLGIPYNVSTYLSAFLLYYIGRPAVVRPPDIQLVMALSDGTGKQIPVYKQTQQPKKSHLQVVRSNSEDEPPKAS